MMEIYPYGGALAYMKYHYMDGVLKQNLMLMDKTRYDHDKGDKAAVARRPKGEEETKRLREEETKRLRGRTLCETLRFSSAELCENLLFLPSSFFIIPYRFR